ncbi:conserved hypothetical protein [Archaeoglobus fulgidus DSM 4304]|uniref:Uncharacterized protein AF_2188 n=1 Tax=Archaeoglobus fulgidus (strain ATCC 49558 / DSM 4304 / JCM 9628 / NBRC 100126 / VC-16) TaxID=224325 RepID=Y2188_ARCFU|nr:RecName: Full=Uncharacterized protein AF_2188 [Archaeoglobus fulgidus DSM 4304]AAB89065.1 conserved hypothetical protein [Archaeoglobus fulgidus DSM 4304]
MVIVFVVSFLCIEEMRTLSISSRTFPRIEASIPFKADVISWMGIFLFWMSIVSHSGISICSCMGGVESLPFLISKERCNSTKKLNCRLVWP